MQSLHHNYTLNKTVSDRYQRLLAACPCNKTQCMYIWIDGTLENLRAKTRTLAKTPQSIGEVPLWQYDGSSCYQALGANSDVTLRPVAMFPDPFRLGTHKLVLCDTLDQDNKPLKTNTRASCAETMKFARTLKPWFGMEQEYTMLDLEGYPLGWPHSPRGMPKPQGPYYCGVGADKVVARDVVESHYRACLYTGLDIFGSNAEVMPAQWEYQIGPSEGVGIGDHMWMSRFLLHRIAEDFGIKISFDPKPVEGDWNGAGCHCNFSTEAMRKPGGIAAITAACERLAQHHHQHMAVYDVKHGMDNLRRLSGRHETSDPNKFTYGVANRSASVRIPRSVQLAGCGYLEDRRPASNCDPYMVSEAIIRSVCRLWDSVKQ